MKRLSFLLGLIICLALTQSAYSQAKTYTTSGGEMVFSWGDLKYTDQFKQDYGVGNGLGGEAEIVGNPVRFTMFFHLQQFWHLDLNNNIGFFTGIGIRNIGMISDERLPNSNFDPNNPPANTQNYFNAKIIRRSYTLGIPLAIKLGSFKDHLNVYAGGEIEWAFHMKEKWWDSHSRSGSKTKSTSWWPDQITTFLPSTFIGLQFPGGVNLKVKYYLENFLNHDYGKGTLPGTPSKVVSDLSKYEKSNLFYVSLAFHFKTNELLKNKESRESVASLY